MGILDLFLQTSSSVSLSGALVVLLLIYLVSTFSFNSQENRKDPPGPKPLPLLGNLLQLDLGRPYSTLLEFSKKYGPVFTVYLGPKKVVVLAGYKTVKEALVKYSETGFKLRWCFAQDVHIIPVVLSHVFQSLYQTDPISDKWLTRVDRSCFIIIKIRLSCFRCNDWILTLRKDVGLPFIWMTISFVTYKS
uniref:Uncharacterized protein n=1 Tax=Lates calcarifer TaxID=8187 RepID=A0A4W6F7Y6_LATCA